MRVIVFTGQGGSGVSTIAAATGVAAARAGHRTLVFGFAAGLSDALGQTLADSPVRVMDNLEGVQGKRDGRDKDEFRRWLERLLDWRGINIELAEDLTALPGMDQVGRLLDLEGYVTSGRYEAIIVDAAPLGQFLDVPPALAAAERWLDRLFAPRQASPLEPFLRVFAGDYASAGDDVLESGRDLLGRLAALRAAFVDAGVSSLRLVLRAETPAVRLAGQVLSLLTLASFPVDAVVMNRALTGAASQSLGELAAEHEAALAAIREAVEPMPVFAVDLRSPAPRGEDRLAALAARLYGPDDPLAVLHAATAHSLERNGNACVLSFNLPLLAADGLRLEQVNDGITVHVDGRRAFVPLPGDLRYYDSASWAYEGGVLKVTFQR
jgi:arsenite-transporting ATPase